MRQVILVGLVLLLAGCGGNRDDNPRDRSGGVSRGAAVAYGPISKACMNSDRKARSSELCACIQAAANQSLSRSEQRRAAQFYTDPHAAQVIRQSDRETDEAFWRAYKAYGERAKQMCG